MRADLILNYTDLSITVSQPNGFRGIVTVSLEANETAIEKRGEWSDAYAVGFGIDYKLFLSLDQAKALRMALTDYLSNMNALSINDVVRIIEESEGVNL